MIVNKKREPVIPVDHRVKIKGSQKRGNNLDLAGEVKTTEHGNDDVTNCKWYAQNNPQRIGKRDKKKKKMKKKKKKNEII